MSNIILDTMYENIPFSKNTRLANSILSSDTSITVEDGTVFPAAPNYATIGTDENAETILYNAISSNELQNVERAKEGTAKSWSSGEIISRNFSNVDVVAFSNNITKIANFLNSHGNLFEYRKKTTNYTAGKLVQIPNINNYIYLECVESGTSSGSDITVISIGQLITDGTCKWLTLDIRDSAPVGTIKQDIIIRDGWLKLNGATVNVADYPRLVSFLTANSLIHAYTVFPVATDFTYGDSNNETLLLPDFEGLFIENSVNNTLSKVNAGLPDISGAFTFDLPNTTVLRAQGAGGAFHSKTSVSNIKKLTPATGTESGNTAYEFNASYSNSIYGNSTTVQPPAVKLIPIIKY